MTPKNIPSQGTGDQAGGVRPIRQRDGDGHDDHGWSLRRHAWRRYAAAVGIVAVAVALPMVFMLLILIPAEHARKEPGILASFPMGRIGLILLQRKNYDQRIHGR